MLGSNDSQINPHMRAKFGCSQTVVSTKKKGGGGTTDRQTDRQTDTKGHCSFIIEVKIVMLGRSQTIFLNPYFQFENEI